jgi:hypothetical protein
MSSSAGPQHGSWTLTPSGRKSSTGSCASTARCARRGAAAACLPACPPPRLISHGHAPGARCTPLAAHGASGCGRASTGRQQRKAPVLRRPLANPNPRHPRPQGGSIKPIPPTHTHPPPHPHPWQERELMTSTWHARLTAAQEEAATRYKALQVGGSAAGRGGAGGRGTHHTPPVCHDHDSCMPAGTRGAWGRRSLSPRPPACPRPATSLRSAGSAAPGPLARPGAGNLVEQTVRWMAAEHSVPLLLLLLARPPRPPSRPRGRRTSSTRASPTSAAASPTWPARRRGARCSAQSCHAR